MRCEIATMENRPPSRQALASAASVRPVTGHRQRLAQAAQAGVAEGGDDHGVEARVVLGRQLRRGIGADQGLEAGLDVGHAEGRGEHVHGGAGRRAAPRLGADQLGHAVGDVGIDDEAAQPMRWCGSARGLGSNEGCAAAQEAACAGARMETLAVPDHVAARPASAPARPAESCLRRACSPPRGAGRRCESPGRPRPRPPGRHRRRSRWCPCAGAGRRPCAGLVAVSSTKLLERDAPAEHAFGIQQRQPRLDAGDAVRDVAEGDLLRRRLLALGAS
jgi:hypothetical protein